MAKAKWKEPPLQRAFGEHPAVQQNKDLKHELFELKEKLAYVKAQKEAVAAAHKGLHERLKKYESANMRYSWLKAQGVVLEYNGEFKHLKGGDMDKFFEDTPLPGFLGSIYAQALANSMRQTKEAVAQTLIYGSNATHMFFDEAQDPTKWP